MAFEIVQSGINGILGNEELDNQRESLDRFISKTVEKFRFSADDLDELDKVFPKTKELFKQELTNTTGALRMYAYLKTAQSQQDRFIELTWQRLRNNEERSSSSFEVLEEYTSKEEVAERFSERLNERIQMVKEKLQSNAEVEIQSVSE